MNTGDFTLILYDIHCFLSNNGENFDINIAIFVVVVSHVGTFKLIGKFNITFLNILKFIHTYALTKFYSCIWFFSSFMKTTYHRLINVWCLIRKPKQTVHQQTFLTPTARPGNNSRLSGNPAKCQNIFCNGTEHIHTILN